MDKNVSHADKSEDLLYELEKLKMDLEQSNDEKANAAEYGLVILEEKNQLKFILDQKDAALENLKAQLICSQEALAAMQQHNKALEEADLIEEEKRVIHEEVMKKEREDLESGLRSFKKQLAQSVEEKITLEELLKQCQLNNEKTLLQLKNMKEDLRDCESRENYALKNCDILECDNLELQLQVSQLLKSLQHFDVVQSENKRLLEKVEEMSRDIERYESFKVGMEKSLNEMNDMLKDERELKMRYKRELDAQVLTNEGSFLNASTVASLHSLIGVPSSMVGDFSIDNISVLLDGYVTCNGDDDDACSVANRGDHICTKSDGEEKSNDMNDSLEDLTFDQNNIYTNNAGIGEKSKIKKMISKDLMSELMMTQDEYIINVEKLEMENMILNKTIDDLKHSLDSYINGEMVNEPHIGQDNLLFINSKEIKATEELINVPTSTSATQTSNEDEDLEDAMKCLLNVRSHLLDMVTEAQSTYTSLCSAAGENLNSKAMMHVDARKASVHEKMNLQDREVLGRHIPSFKLSKSSLKCTDRHVRAENESVSHVEVDCTKLLASSIDLMRYSRRVVNRMMDTKMAARTRESSLLSSSLESSFCSSTNGHSTTHQVPLTSSSNFEFQDQVFQLQHLLAAKTDQLMSLRQMLSANKVVYESSIDKLKQQHCDEIRMKMIMIGDLKRNVNELREKEEVALSSKQTLVKQCDHFSCLMNDLNERLTSSELERKTLNSLLRIAIQHKLLLVKKLQSHGISFDLFSEQDSSVERVSTDNQLESRRFPLLRQPTGSRYPSSPSFHQNKQSSFTPLLYSPSKHK